MTGSKAEEGSRPQHEDGDDAEPEPERHLDQDSDASASLDDDYDTESGSDAYCDAGRRGGSRRKSTVRKRTKRPEWTRKEEETLAELHCNVGNQWSLIAARLPGRTPNEVKNIWHSTLRSKHLKARSLLRAYATTLNGRWDDESSRQEAYNIAVRQSGLSTAEGTDAGGKHALSDASACTKDAHQHHQQQQHAQLDQCITPTYGAQLAPGGMLLAQTTVVTTVVPGAPTQQASQQRSSRASSGRAQAEKGGQGGPTQRQEQQPKRQQGGNKRARTNSTLPSSPDDNRADASCVVVATSRGAVKAEPPGNTQSSQLTPSSLAGPVANGPPRTLPPYLSGQRPFGADLAGTCAPTGGVAYSFTPFGTAMAPVEPGTKPASHLSSAGPPNAVLTSVTVTPGTSLMGPAAGPQPSAPLSAGLGRPGPGLGSSPGPMLTAPGVTWGFTSQQFQQPQQIFTHPGIQAFQPQQPGVQMQQPQQQHLVRSPWTAANPDGPLWLLQQQQMQHRQQQGGQSAGSGRGEPAMLPPRKRSSFSTGFDATESLLGLENPDTWLGRMDDSIMLLPQEDEAGADPDQQQRSGQLPGADAASSTAARAVTTGTSGQVGAGNVPPAAGGAAAGGAAVVTGNGGQHRRGAEGGAADMAGGGVESGPMSGTLSSNDADANAPQPPPTATILDTSQTEADAKPEAATGTDADALGAPPAGNLDEDMSVQDPDTSMALVAFAPNIVEDDCGGNDGGAVPGTGPAANPCSPHGDAVITPTYGAASTLLPAGAGTGDESAQGPGWPAMAGAPSAPHDAARGEPTAYGPPQVQQQRQVWQQGASGSQQESGCKLEALRSGVHTLNSCMGMIPVSPSPLPQSQQVRQQPAPTVPPHLLAPPVRAYRAVPPHDSPHHQHHQQQLHMQQAMMRQRQHPQHHQQHFFSGQGYHYGQHHQQSSEAQQQHHQQHQVAMQGQQQQQQPEVDYRRQVYEQFQGQQQQAHTLLAQPEQAQPGQGQQLNQQVRDDRNSAFPGQQHYPQQLQQQQQQQVVQPPNSYRHLQARLLRPRSDAAYPGGNCITDVVTMGLDAILDPQLRWCLVDTASGVCG